MTNDTKAIEQRRAKRREVFDKLKETFFLPSPSGTVMEVVRLCSSEDASLSEIADRIQTDPSLSSEIIKYANSAFLSTGIQVASVQKATVKLGMKSVVTLAIGFSLLAGHRSGNCDNFNYQLFWKKSLAKAIAARELTKLNKDFDPEELFICGLLCHMGSLSLATIFPEEYSKLLEDCPDNTPYSETESKQFGIDSSELTSELFIEWGLPVVFALSAGFHKDIGYVELGTGKTLRAAVYLSLADNIAQMCQSIDPQLELLEATLSMSDEYNIELGVFSETFQTIVDNWHDLGSLFEIATSQCYSYNNEE